MDEKSLTDNFFTIFAKKIIYKGVFQVGVIFIEFCFLYTLAHTGIIGLVSDESEKKTIC